jgi:hypothetical protein
MDSENLIARREKIMANCVDDLSIGQLQTQETTPASKEVTLDAHEVCRLKASVKPVRITALSGNIWITLSGELQDFVLRGGESLELSPRKLTLVEGLSKARFRVSPVG